jgi:hypothetical protein
MTQTIPHQAHTVYSLRNCQTRTQVRHDAESMLRDLAFVLKMTERVRDEIETDVEEREPALV